MVVVDFTRFSVFMVVTVVLFSLGLLLQQFIFWFLAVLIMIGLVLDAFTAKRCPNGHIVYVWSRSYGWSPSYCPRCGEPLDRDDSVDGESEWARVEDRNEHIQSD